MPRYSFNDNDLSALSFRVFGGLKFSVFAAISLTLTACGGFRSEWNNPANHSETGVVGRWQGEWKSNVNGHAGQLRCIVTELPEPARYYFHYHAVWAKILRASYQLECQASEVSFGVWEFEGSKDLGSVLGTYAFDGRIEEDVFAATYSGGFDEGTFQMERVRDE